LEVGEGALSGTYFSANVGIVMEPKWRWRFGQQDVREELDFARDQ